MKPAPLKDKKHYDHMETGHNWFTEKDVAAAVEWFLEKCLDVKGFPEMPMGVDHVSNRRVRKFMKEAFADVMGETSEA